MIGVVDDLREGKDFMGQKIYNRQILAALIATTLSCGAQAQLTGFLSMSLGTRISDTTIVNTSLGIGLTEDAPDFSLGVSLPINFSGLKE